MSDRLLPGDRFLLCSDGLCKTLPENELASLLAAIDGTPPQALIDAALALDASDNVTAVAVEFTGRHLLRGRVDAKRRREVPQTCRHPRPTRRRGDLSGTLWAMPSGHIFAMVSRS